ncbi:MAG: PIN domain-containing protein [Acidobacteriota bacterium]
MRESFFLDTNIFLYSIDRTEPRKAEVAGDLLRRGIETGKGVISYQVVQEFLNVALKGFVSPMSPAEAQHYLAMTFGPIFTVHSSPALYGEALRIHSAYRFAWYDSLIVAAALQARCGTLYTEDLSHGQRVGNLRIVNPFL